MYLGVPAEGDDRPAQDDPVVPELGPLPTNPVAEVPVAVAQGAAHTYTESARIWNPIHTDASVAEAAGLPAIILHGTATLALGVSATIATLGSTRAAPTASGTLVRAVLSQSQRRRRTRSACCRARCTLAAAPPARALGGCTLGGATRSSSTSRAR